MVLEPALHKVDQLILIGRRRPRIAMQRAAGGMAVSFIGMTLASIGYLPPVAGAIAQEVVDLAAALNAFTRSVAEF